MKIEENELFELFDALPYAHVAVQNGDVVYANPAAAKLLGRALLEIPAQELFGGLAEPTSGVSDGVVTVGERHFTARAVGAGPLRLITIEESGGEAPYDEAAVSGICRVINDKLSVCTMAMDALTSRAEASSDVGSLNIIAQAGKALYGISRLSENLYRVMGGGSWRLDGTHFDLVLLISDLINTTSSLTDGGPALKFVTSLQSLPYFGDAMKLELMMMNLISNALKFSPPDGNVTVSLRRSPAGALIAVSDSGPGVPPEELHDMFSKYSSPRPIPDPRSGAGFGLGIVQKIAALHGGSAVLTSSQGAGVTVTVSLPLDGSLGVSSREPELRSPASVLLREYSDVLPASAYRLGPII